MEITSTRNAHVVDLARLARPRDRRARGLHLVEGPHAVTEALAAAEVVEVLAVAGAADGLVLGDTPCTMVAEHVLARLADTLTPQGLVAVVRTPVPRLETAVGSALTVVLVGLADPGNAGTLIRTADAAGAGAVVLTEGSVDPYGAKALRAAAGSTYHLPVVTGVSVAEVVSACRDRGAWLAGLDGGGAGSVFALEERAGPVALFLGNEAHGLPDDVLASMDDVVAVPIIGRAESLNVAAAGAVAVFAAARGSTGRGPAAG